MSESIGIIAGSGQFPRLVAEDAKAAGYGVVACAFHGFTDPGLEALADAYTTVYLGQFDKVKAAVEAAGRSFERELNNLYVSGPIARAVMAADANFASSEAEAKLAKGQPIQSATHSALDCRAAIAARNDEKDKKNIYDLARN